MHRADDAMPLDHEEQAADWCWRIADRALTEAERGAFDAWLRADPRHREAFDEMVTVWEGTDAIAEMPGFLSLRAKALTTMETARRPMGRWRGGWQRVFAAAAALILMLGSGAWYLGSGPDVYVTGIGERQVVRLEDGSRVSLDASSRVTVAYSDDKRALILERGRAKFDVAKDPLRPFSVTADHRTVVATGTAFSVELLRDQMRVLLYEGHVAVLAQPPGKAPAPVRIGGRSGAEVQLSPGQELVATRSSDTAIVKSIDSARSLSWEGGRLTFIDEPLARAVERVNRYADTPIVIGDAALGAYPVNGVFDAGNTRGFVSGVTAIFPVAARTEGREILLIRKAEPLPAK
jgi:transmembrane sensor